jgi:hypothetical protein
VASSNVSHAGGDVYWLVKPPAQLELLDTDHVTEPPMVSWKIPSLEAGALVVGLRSTDIYSPVLTEKTGHRDH